MKFKGVRMVSMRDLVTRGFRRVGSPGASRWLAVASLACLAVSVASCVSLLQEDPTPPEGPAFTDPPGPLSPARAMELARELSLDSQYMRSYTELAMAVADSRRWAERRPPTETAFERPWVRLTWGQLAQTARELEALLPALDEDPTLLAQRFVWLQLAPRSLLTGYYEPLLDCSLTPAPGYAHPLYGKPPEQGALPTRDAIDHHGALAGRGLEIAWCKDPTDVFFLHVQGSGRLRLPGGGERHALWAGSNKHPYTSVGKVLIEEGYGDRHTMSMQTIRALFAAHPEKVRGWLAHNRKYIFFRLADEGPIGAMNTRLTPRGSVAVDRDFIPLGAILALDAPLPGGDGYAPQRLQGLVAAQDTGVMDGNHLDLFMGFGAEAEARAGRMKGRAATRLLVSRSALGL